MLRAAVEQRETPYLSIRKPSGGYFSVFAQDKGSLRGYPSIKRENKGPLRNT